MPARVMKSYVLVILACIGVVLVVLWLRPRTTYKTDVGPHGVGAIGITGEQIDAENARKTDRLEDNRFEAKRSVRPESSRLERINPLSPISSDNVKELANFMVWMESDDFPDAAQTRDRNNRYENEPRDDTWAVEMERMLGIELRTRADRLSGIEMQNPACRQTICVLAAVDPYAVRYQRHRWNEAIQSIGSTKWWNANFRDMSSGTNVVNNKVFYVTYMERRLSP